MMEHQDVLNELHEIYTKKNADYGNSFSEQFNKYGLVSSLIRLEDKLRRLENLSKHTRQVEDETITDTLLDLANYAIMTVMVLKK
jgi:hypothetical protein